MSVRLKTGDVVQVYTSKYGGKQGIGLIKYIGNIAGDIMKQYVGIELIEPIENGHNGIIDSIQYFQCKESYGIHVLITNVIKILETAEIMIKLQEVIEMFKNKLSQYIGALNQRDSYISDLIQTQKKLQSLISIHPSQPQPQIQIHNIGTLNQSHHNPPLTPIVDSTSINNTNNLTYEQMLHNVDNAITAQSLAIKLDAKRIQNNEFQMHYQTPLTHKSNTTKSSNNYSPITATNTLDSGTPSSMTPAPKNIAIKTGTAPTAVSSPVTMVINNSGSDSSYDDRLDSNDSSGDDSNEPDPLMTPTMDPIAETHSFPNPNIGITNNTQIQYSPSQPKLFMDNKESNGRVSTLSGNSPLTPYGNNQMIYYPEYDVASTSSNFSGNSSTYNTNSKITPKSSTAPHLNHHGLLAAWNNRKLSKQSNRSHKSNENQPKLRSRENSKANKSHSHSRSRKEKQKVPHIYTGTNTPTLSANNDAILSGKAYDLPPITVPNKQIRTEYNNQYGLYKSQKNINKKTSRNRNKSKELKIDIKIKNTKNRSSSLICTPSQLQSMAKYSFKTIQEEESPNNHTHKSPSDSDINPNDTPRFNTHHSTPIFNMAAQQQIQYINNHHNNNNMNDDDGTPELPNDNLFQMDNIGIMGRNNSLPTQETHNILKSRYNHSNQPQRSSLPPQQSQPNIHQNNHMINHEYKHMSASSQINIAVPTFTFNKNNNQKRYNKQQMHFQSLQNIHEQKMYNKPIQTQIAYHQSAPQLDHWVDPQQIQMQQQQQQQYINQQIRNQNQRPISAHDYTPNDYDYNIPNTLPGMNNKAKSMPAPHQSFHIPSQQSIDMNPYIDAQFIGFQPQTSDPNNNNNIPNIDMIEGVPIGPPIRRSPQSSRSPLNGPMPPQHNTTNNPMAYSVHSGVSSSHSPSFNNHNHNHNNHNIINHNVNVPQPIITNNIQNVVLGKVQFAPRQSLTKQMRRMSKNSNKNINVANHSKVQRVPQSKTNVIKHSQHNKSQIQIQSQQSQQIYQLNPQNMSGFTLTDAMYD